MSLSTSPRRKRWNAGILAGALALLVEIVAWAWMPMPAVGAGFAEICTMDGMRTVAVDAAGAPLHPGEGGKVAGTGACPLCPLVAGLALPPPDAGCVRARAVAGTAVVLPQPQAVSGWLLSTRRARAPPTLG